MRYASVLRLAALSLFLIPLAGCWSTDNEVFSSSEAVLIPRSASLEQNGGTYNGHQMHISRIGGSNDYSFSIEGSGPVGCAANKGTFRAVQIKDDIYVLQILCEAAKNDQEYNIQFYTINSGGYHTAAPAVNDWEARLIRYNLKFDAPAISGTPSNINAFLRSLKDSNFSPSSD
jgi:hypothetical protein